MKIIEFLNANTKYAWISIGIVGFGILVYSLKYLNLLNKKEIESVNLFKNIGQNKIIQTEIRVDKKVKVELEDSRIKSWHPVKSKSWFSFERYKGWFLDKYFTEDIVLIHMELFNNFIRVFVVKGKDNGFRFKGDKYLFDDESKIYNIDAKLYMYYYHQGVCLPFKIKIPVVKTKKALESNDDVDIGYAINPSTLQRFMTAKIAEGVMKGTQLDEFFRKLQMFLIVTMVAVLVHLALFLYGSGMLKNIKVPGILG